MQDHLCLDIGTDSPDIVAAVIEFPKDSTNKYEYDKKRQVFRLDRNLYSPVHSPQDYGFIAQTLAEDKEGLDDQLEDYGGMLLQWAKNLEFALQKSVNSYLDAYRGILESRLIDPSENFNPAQLRDDIHTLSAWKSPSHQFESVEGV
jgi:hypothetical protein